MNESLVIFVFAGLNLLFIGLLMFQKTRHGNLSKRQLARYVSRKDVPSKHSAQWLLALITGKERERLSRLLANAGILGEQSLAWLLAIKMVCGVVLAGLAVLHQISNGQPILSMWCLTLVLVGYVLGANLPEWWLKMNADRHRKQLQLATPDAIDLLVLCVESGLSLNKAFNRVAHYLSMQGSPIAEQFRVTAAELDVLNDRHHALANLSWRTGVSELHTLASTLQMADKYGSPLATTLRQISDDARRQRALNLEEQAGKLPGKITLIQMAMIMLPMLVMIVAPVLHQLLTSLA